MFDFFQGRPLLHCLLPIVCQLESAGKAQPPGVVTVLLGFPLRVCRRIYGCSGRQPL